MTREANPLANLGSVHVANLKSGYPLEEGEVAIRVDRANPILGNPFKITRRQDPHERARVLGLHAQHVAQDRAAQGPITQALHALAARVNAGEHLVLQCWCAPLPCHGDTLARAIQDEARRQREQVVPPAGPTLRLLRPRA